MFSYFIFIILKTSLVCILEEGMMSEYIYTLPEVSLIFGIINLLFLYILGYDTNKIYARTARTWLIISLFFSILFYNVSFAPQYFENNSYTLLFKLIIGFFTYIMLVVSSSWFMLENKTGCKYLVLILTSILISYLLLSAINTIIILTGYVALIYTNYRLLNLNYDKISKDASMRYIAISLIIMCFLFIGFSYIYITTGSITEYSLLKQIISSSNSNIYTYLAIIFMIIPILYSLDIAPFHFMVEEKVAKSILPVSHYFSIILPLIQWGVLIKMKEYLLLPFDEFLSTAFLVLAVLSIILGAIGANSRINLYRIYAYGSMYHFGVIMILLSFFTKNTDYSSFIYLLMYILALNGIYIVFYNIKSHGEFLSSLTSLSGYAQTRPHTTRTLLISIFSLLGLPPLAGFLSTYSFIDSFLIEKRYILLIIVMIFFFILAKSYLEIIKTAYFEQKIKNYDTENKTVLLVTLLNIILIIIISFNPFGIIEKIKDMFNVIYI